MRLSVLPVALLLCAAPARAQEPPPFHLPVSIERIRERLAAPSSLLDALDRQPDFRVEVQETRPTFAEMFSPDDFKGGPIPPGGLYAYEQQRRLFPNSSSPALSFDALPAFRELLGAIGDVRRARAAAAARAEVERAMATFCAAQPNGGEGVAGCGGPPAR